MDKIVSEEKAKRPNEDTYSSDSSNILTPSFSLLMSYVIDCTSDTLLPAIPADFQSELLVRKQQEQLWWSKRVQQAFHKFEPLLQAIQRNHSAFSPRILKQQLYLGKYGSIEMDPYFKEYAIRTLLLW